MLEMLSNDTRTEIEVLTAPTYELHTSSPYRFRFRVGHRARLFVAEPMVCGVPDGEFVVEQHGTRYRVKREGKLSRTLVFVKLGARRYDDRLRERFFYPVRVLGIEALKGARPRTQEEAVG